MQPARAGVTDVCVRPVQLGVQRVRCSIAGSPVRVPDRAIAGRGERRAGGVRRAGIDRSRDGQEDLAPPTQREQLGMDLNPPTSPVRAGSSFAEHHKLCFGVLCAGFTGIFALASLAMLTHAPLIFPSLGATTFLLLSAWKTEAASPRNVLCGHAIAIACGYFALLVTGLADAPPAMVTGVVNERVLATALSMGFSGALMLLFHVPHAPAGATTLIVSLGLVGQPLLPYRLLIVEGAVALLVAMAFLLHRCRGRDYPLWRHPRSNTFEGGVP